MKDHEYSSPSHMSEHDIPLAALANNMLNVRLDLSLAFGYGVRETGANLRENFIDAVDITRIACE